VDDRSHGTPDVPKGWLIRPTSKKETRASRVVVTRYCGSLLVTWILTWILTWIFDLDF